MSNGNFTTVSNGFWIMSFEVIKSNLYHWADTSCVNMMILAFNWTEKNWYCFWNSACICYENRLVKTCTQEFFQQSSHLWFRLCYRLVGTFHNIILVASVDSFLCTYIYLQGQDRGVHIGNKQSYIWKMSWLFVRGRQL